MVSLGALRSTILLQEGSRDPDLRINVVFTMLAMDFEPTNFSIEEQWPTNLAIVNPLQFIEQLNVYEKISTEMCPPLSHARIR